MPGLARRGAGDAELGHRRAAGDVDQSEPRDPPACPPAPARCRVGVEQGLDEPRQHRLVRGVEGAAHGRQLDRLLEALWSTSV